MPSLDRYPGQTGTGEVKANPLLGPQKQKGPVKTSRSDMKPPELRRNSAVVSHCFVAIYYNSLGNV